MFLTADFGCVTKNWARPKTNKRSVTARIGFSVDSDLHEKLLRRIESRWCKNHVESDLCFCFRLNFFLFSVQNEFVVRFQKHWVRYYMVRQSYKIGSMLHVKSDLNVLIRFYLVSNRWIGSDLQRSGAAWSGQEVSSGFALAARAAHSQLALAASTKNIRIHTW